MLCIVTLIFGVVLLRSNEIHRPIAGVVFMAVDAPIFCVPRRYVQINGWRSHGLRLDQHGLCVDHLRRRCAPNVYLTVQAGRHFTRQKHMDVQAARVADANTGENDRKQCD